MRGLSAMSKEAAPAPERLRMAEGKAQAYIIGRVRAMGRHADAEIAAIAACMHALRSRFQSSQQEWSTKPLFVGFHGFATDFERSVFLRCIKYCTKPRIVHSAFMPNGAFEGLLIIHPTTEAAQIEDIENLMQLFKMSAGVTDLGAYMSPPMVACIERVESGSRLYGNWRNMRAAPVRTAYLRAKATRDTELSQEHVRQVTGLPFSTGNMLAIHYQLNNTQIELGQAGELLLRLRNLLSSLPPTFNVYGSERIQEPSPMHDQYVRNMQQLIDTLISSWHPHGPPPRNSVSGLRAILIDLT